MSLMLRAVAVIAALTLLGGCMPKPDVHITDASMEWIDGGVKYSYKVMNVKNDGGISGMVYKPMTVRAYLSNDGRTEAAKVGEWKLRPHSFGRRQWLAPGQEVAGEFAYTPSSGFVKGNATHIILRIDEDNAVAERNEDNNFARIEIPPRS